MHVQKFFSDRGAQPKNVTQIFFLKYPSGKLRKIQQNLDTMHVQTF